MIITQKLNAPNDTSGNPRRLWIVYNADTGLEREPQLMVASKEWSWT